MLLSGCASDPPAAPAAASGTAVDVKTHSGTPVNLNTHCGIRYLQVGDGWFERVGGPLDDGNGNPPSGWGNPLQPGHVTLSGDLAIFRDDAGHQESFKRLDGPRSTATPCA
jgi:hypothetical protein